MEMHLGDVMLGAVDAPLQLAEEAFYVVRRGAGRADVLARFVIDAAVFDERSTEWAVPRCIGMGDVSHLYAAGLPVQARGIIANFD